MGNMTENESNVGISLFSLALEMSLDLSNQERQKAQGGHENPFLLSGLPSKFCSCFEIALEQEPKPPPVRKAVSLVNRYRKEHRKTLVWYYHY